MELRKGYKQTEVGVIPEDWEVRKLGELLKFKNGINAPKSAYGRGFPFINVLDIIQNITIQKDLIIGRVAVPTSQFSAYKVENGDILFQRSSETAEEVGQAAAYIDSSGPVTFGGFVILGKKNYDFDSLYLNYQLKSVVSRNEIVQQSGGSTRYNVSQVALRAAKTLLPKSLPEQRAIATALGDVDALLSSLDRLIAKKEALKQGAMQVLLSGEKRLEGFSGAWEVRKLGEVFTVMTGNTPRTSNPNYYGTDYWFAGPSDLNQTPELQETEKMLSIDGWKIARQYPPKTVLFTCIGEIGKTAITLRPCSSNQQINAILPNDIQDPVFTYYLMTHLAPAIKATAATQVLPMINKSSFEEVSLVLPKLTEQTAIATILSDMDAELAALRARRAKVVAIKKGMMGELLTGRVRLV